MKITLTQLSEETHGYDATLRNAWDSEHHVLLNSGRNLVEIGPNSWNFFQILAESYSQTQNNAKKVQISRGKNCLSEGSNPLLCTCDARTARLLATSVLGNWPKFSKFLQNSPFRDKRPHKSAKRVKKCNIEICPSRESNMRPLRCKSNALTVRPPRRPVAAEYLLALYPDTPSFRNTSSFGQNSCRIQLPVAKEFKESAKRLEKCKSEIRPTGDSNMRPTGRKSNTLTVRPGRRLKGAGYLLLIYPDRLQDRTPGLAHTATYLEVQLNSD